LEAYLQGLKAAGSALRTLGERFFIAEEKYPIPPRPRRVRNRGQGNAPPPIRGQSTARSGWFYRPGRAFFIGWVSRPKKHNKMEVKT